MNELDSYLEKTSEIFEIGSVEKKLQPFKVGNKTQNFKISKLPRLLDASAGPHKQSVFRWKIWQLVN